MKKIKNSNKKPVTIGGIVLQIVLLIIAFIQIYPFIWLLLFSFKSNGEIFGSNVVGFPNKLLWENYQQALTNGKAGIYFFNSALVTVVTIVISSLVAAMASYGIVRMKWKLSGVTLIFFLMGLMIPIHAALLPLFMFFSKLKQLNSYWSLIFPYVGFAIPMAIYIFSGFLRDIPKEMEESALLDGCSIYNSFFRIILPLIKPAMATVSIFTFLSSWNELMFAVTFISKWQYRTLTVGIQQMAGQYTTSWGPIGAGLVIATIPTLLIYCLLSNQVQKSLISGAVKG